jgi:hypothetical protein
MEGRASRPSPLIMRSACDGRAAARWIPLRDDGRLFRAVGWIRTSAGIACFRCKLRIMFKDSGRARRMTSYTRVLLIASRPRLR